MQQPQSQVALPSPLLSARLAQSALLACYGWVAHTCIAGLPAAPLPQFPGSQRDGSGGAADAAAPKRARLCQRPQVRFLQHGSDFRLGAAATQMMAHFGCLEWRWRHPETGLLAGPQLPAVSHSFSARCAAWAARWPRCARWTSSSTRARTTCGCTPTAPPASATACLQTGLRAR